MGGKKIWIKNPFTNDLGVFEARKSTDACENIVQATGGQINTPSRYDDEKNCEVVGDIADEKGIAYTLSRAMRGAD